MTLVDVDTVGFEDFLYLVHKALSGCLNAKHLIYLVEVV
jgi:hypothetical protein